MERAVNLWLWNGLGRKREENRLEGREVGNFEGVMSVTHD